jgi:FAD/FMN-containing dehydrogenase
VTSLARLRDVVAGEVLEPGMPGYEAVRRPAMARFWDVRPRAVVRCASAADVARALTFARRTGLPVVPRGGGHCFAGRSSTDGIVLDLTPLRSIRVSPAGPVTIGAGARLAEVYDGLHEHGLALPAGCGPGVGIAGLTLGGGLGILGRRHGLTCDRLAGARVVLASGQIVDCDEHREPELFWALRGAGGGQFGVVTSLVFDPVPAPEATRIELTWPHREAAAVVAAWQRWAPGAPDEMSASLKIASGGGDGGNGGDGGPPLVLVSGAMAGPQADAAALLDDLVRLAGAGPATRRLTALPYRDLKRSLAGPGPARPYAAGLTRPAVSKSEFFREPLPDRSVTELLEIFGQDRRPGQHRELNFTPMGGAYNRVPAGATAFVHRSERFLLEHAMTGAGAGADPERWVQRSWAAAHPWGSGRVYPNFPDPDLADWAEAYHGGNHARLAAVKRACDPHRLLHFHQSV